MIKIPVRTYVKRIENNKQRVPIIKEPVKIFKRPVNNIKIPLCIIEGVVSYRCFTFSPRVEL